MEHDSPTLQIARRRLRPGLLAVTAAVHLGLAWMFFVKGVPGQAAGGPVARMAWIDLPALPAPPEPLAEPAAEPPPRPARSRAAQPRKPRPARASAAITLPAPVHADTSSAPADPATPAAGEPVFDRDAALAAARKHANDADPARAGTALAQFDARRMLKETEQEKLGRKIAGAKRGDCIGPNAGGNLLTPLFWILDKKGGGCKF